jgi:hypothetical protein
MMIFSIFPSSKKVEPHGLKPVAPPHASSGLPSPKQLRASRRNPPKHTLLRSLGASKGTLPTFIHGLKTRGFLRRRVTQKGKRVKAHRSQKAQKESSEKLLSSLLIEISGLFQKSHKNT